MWGSADIPRCNSMGQDRKVQGALWGYGYRDMWKPYSLGWFLERIHLVTIFNSENVKFGLRDPETI